MFDQKHTRKFPTIERSALGGKGSGLHFANRALGNPMFRRK
jgi:hypothetical protein